MKLFSSVKHSQVKQEYPVVPLRDLIVFPHMVVPFFVGRKGSILSVEAAMSGDRKIFLACQKNSNPEPLEDDIHTVGTVSHILQLLKLPDGTIRVLAEGKQRGCITRFVRKKEEYFAVVRLFEDHTEPDSTVAALMRTIHECFKQYADLYKKIPAEVCASIEKVETPEKLADLICSNVPFKTEKKIEFLSLEDTAQRLEAIAVALESEFEVLALQHKINTKVKRRLEKSQRDYFLTEQLKEINKELGRDAEDPNGIKELEKKLHDKKLPEEVAAKADKELKRLARLQSMSPEAGVLRTYLEWIVDLPWSERSQDNKDIGLAQKILDEDHYDMVKPKDRILDFIAVRQLKDKVKGPILCFVGPPGTGKTSLGKSVARALGREFVRMSLGGVRDEAEIRGHRKTYVGALPGKILQSLRKANTINPVFLLDEVDKMSSDFRGDPASALLEVLDPEQNNSFMDHYLEVPYDLSDVMFITTANSLHNIPYPLRDRMEVIEIPGYTEYEKVKIAEQFIIPKQIEANGLEWAKIDFKTSALLDIIRNYTMESGVRNLEREIANVIRKVARDAVKKIQSTQGGEGVENEVPQDFKAVISRNSLKKYLGTPRYIDLPIQDETRPGLAYGLAWTELGGMLLPVEVSILDGTDQLILTGSLGDVMKESARIALSFLRSNVRKFSIAGEFAKQKDIHIHVPEGAIPKDGPSAGITLTAAMISAVSGFPVNPGFAMTGEITLTGRMLAIGGVKEKVLAAHRYKRSHILLPEPNRKDMEEIPKEVADAIEFSFADSVIDALKVLFPPDLFR